jgi:hypothetical protein
MCHRENAIRLWELVELDCKCVGKKRGKGKLDFLLGVTDFHENKNWHGLIIKLTLLPF